MILLHIILITLLSSVHCQQKRNIVKRPANRDHFKTHDLLFKPYMAVLEAKLDSGLSYCSAILIRTALEPERAMEGQSDILLTSAKCTSGNRARYHPGRLTAILGNYSNVKVGVRFILYHPLYTNWNQGPTYSVAVVRLERPVRFDADIKPLHLPQAALPKTSSCNVTLRSWTAISKPGRTILYPAINTNQLLRLQQQENYLQQEIWKNESSTDNVNIGSPLVCKVGNSGVVQGIYNGISTNRHSTRYHTFSDNVFLKRWIGESLNKIRTLSDVFYHDVLYEYESRVRAHQTIMFIEQLEWIAELATGFNLRKVLDNQLNFPGLNSQDFLKHWTNEKIWEKFVAQPGIFSVRNLQGYISVENVYHCAVICFLKNRNGACSYYSFYKRCYFSSSYHDESEPLLLLSESSVHLRFGALDTAEQPLGSFNGYRKLSDLEYNPQYDNLVWQVSLASPNWVGYHCTCQLGSSRGTAYDYVEISAPCHQSLSESMLNATQKLNVEVTVIPLSRYASGHHVEASFDPKSTNYRLKLTTPIAKTRDTGKIFGQKTEDPSLNRYDPALGAFVPRAFSAPWLVFITNDEGGSNLMCAGVLINRMFTSSANGVAEFVLTNKKCLQGIEPETEVYVIVDSAQYPSIHRQISRVSKVAFHDRKEIALLELEKEIRLNSFAQAIALQERDDPRNYQKDANLTLKSVYHRQGSFVTQDVPLKLTGLYLKTEPKYVDGERIFGKNLKITDEKESESHNILVRYTGTGFLLYSVHSEVPRQQYNRQQHFIILPQEVKWIKQTIIDGKRWIQINS